VSTSIALNNANTKRERLSIRTTAAEKALVEQAASIERVTASHFVMQAALRSAEEVLVDQTRFVLSSDKWAAFVGALDRPAREIPPLKAAAAKKSPFGAR
jgi:uncharacterized protein (DUF1778 family)